MKRFIYILNIIITISFINISSSFSQSKPIISFETLSHDFGVFNEENGPVKYQFKFTNKGNAPLLITDVKASCGCTTPDWTKSPIQPGKSGFVSASFDPANRPGSFDKTITVTSNAEIITLNISGEVIAKVKTDEDLFPLVFDKIRLETNNLGMTKILNTQTKQDTIRVLNTSNENIKLTFTKVPSHIKIRTSTETIKPKEKGYILVNYNANGLNYFGTKLDKVNFLINNKSSINNIIRITATIEEDFSKLSKEQLANAPVIQFEKKEYDFGTVKQGETKNIEIIFTNTGKSDLFIREANNSTGYTITKPNEGIKSGMTGTIKIAFNSTKKGSQRKIITIVSNDPKNTKTYIKILGNVD